MGQACLIWGSFYGLSMKEGPFAIEYNDIQQGYRHVRYQEKGTQFASYSSPKLCKLFAVSRES